MDEETLDERLRAVERTVTDTETPESVADAAAVASRVDELESRVAALEERLDEQDAAVQALRGYVGAVRGVNRDVERRADSALAKVEQLEADATGDADRPGRGQERGRERRRRHDGAATGRRDAPDHPIPEPRERESQGLLARVAGWL